MKLASSIAFRYLFAKKSQNIINIISWISVTGVFVTSVGLLVVLSVFNGLHDLVGSLYGSFDPDLKIESKVGKVIYTDSIDISSLYEIKGVDLITQIIDEPVLYRFDKRQVPGRIMGVDSIFPKVTSIESIIINGRYRLKEGDSYEAVVGYVLADQLALRINFVTPIMIYAPKRKGQINPMRPDQAFTSIYLQTAGVFMVNQLDYDATYSIVDIDKTRQLLQYDDNEVSWIGIKVAENTNVEDVKKQISSEISVQYKVLNREEQHDTFYKMMKVEKLMAYLILSFILMIALFNVIGTLSMLIFEKKSSIATLRSMGADKNLINRIFLIEGWLISLVGLFGGLIVGALLIWIQQTFGILKLGEEGSFVVNAYPVILKFSDVITVIITVSVVGFLAAWYPVKSIVNKYFNDMKDK